MRPFALLFPCLTLACLSLACAAPKSAPAANDEVAQAPAEEASAKVVDPALAPSGAPAPSPEANSAPGADAPAGNSPAEASRFSGDRVVQEEEDSDKDESGLDVRVPMINGGLNRDIIRRVAKDKSSDVLGCVPRALAQNPGLANDIVIELKIDGDGNVSEAKASDETLFTLPDVQACVLGLASGWSFPAPETNTATELTLELRLGPS